GGRRVLAIRIRVVSSSMVPTFSPFHSLSQSVNRRSSRGDNCLTAAVRSSSVSCPGKLVLGIYHSSQPELTSLLPSFAARFLALHLLAAQLFVKIIRLVRG